MEKTFYLEPKNHALWFYLKVKQFAILEGHEHGTMPTSNALWINCDDETLCRLAALMAAETREEELRFDVYNGNGDRVISRLIQTA